VPKLERKALALKPGKSECRGHLQVPPVYNRAGGTYMAKENVPQINPPPEPSTPRLAPWQHIELLCQKLDKLIDLLYAMYIEPGKEGESLSALIEKLSSVEIKPEPWIAGEIMELHRQAFTAVGTFHSSKRADWTKGKRLLIHVESTLNQAVQIQPTGNIRDAADGQTNVGFPMACPAGGTVSVGLAWDDWHPFVGVDIVIAVAPTAGELRAYAVIQE
jgi:hypothetical protein